MLNNCSIYMNCGSQSNLVEPYVGVGIYVDPLHRDNIDRLLKGFPKQIKDISPSHEREVLEALYRLYSIFESRDEEQPIKGDFLLIRRDSIDKWGHRVSCVKAIRSLSIRMKAISGEDSYLFLSDGSMGVERNDTPFRLAALYSRYIRGFYLSSYKCWFPKLSTELPCPKVRPLPSYYVYELVRRTIK